MCYSTWSRELVWPFNNTTILTLTTNKIFTRTPTFTRIASIHAFSSRSLIRGNHTTSENEKLLRILRSQSGDVIHGSVVTPFGAVYGMENESLRSIYWSCWLYRHRSWQQQEIADEKMKRSKQAVAKRWKTGAEDYVFIHGQWTMENGEFFFTSGGAERISPSARQPIAPTCPFLENKSRLGSGVTTPIVCFIFYEKWMQKDSSQAKHETH